MQRQKYLNLIMMMVIVKKKLRKSWIPLALLLKRKRKLRKSTFLLIWNLWSNPPQICWQCLLLRRQNIGETILKASEVLNMREKGLPPWMRKLQEKRLELRRMLRQSIPDSEDAGRVLYSVPVSLCWLLRCTIFSNDAEKWSLGRTWQLFWGRRRLRSRR